MKNKYYKYFHYLIRHKYYVGRELFKHGFYWQALIHDWSKFLPCEWFPYMNYFYGNYKKQSEFSSGEKDVVWDWFKYCKEYWQEKFDRAWLHHIHVSPHHWQHWLLQEDNGQLKTLKMPRKYAIEMYCDWLGAGMAIHGKNDIVEWYEKNKEIIKLHPETRDFVESLIYKK